MAEISGIGTVYSLILMQIFYGVAITLLVMVLPLSGAQMTWFNNADGVMEFSTTSAQIQSSLESSTQIPLLDYGALIFYSSNLFFNLIINIVFGIPMLLSAFLYIFFYFIPIDYTIQKAVQLMFIPIITILYYFILLAWITGTRISTSGGIK